MKRIYPLTSEERDFASENIKLVYGFLHSKSLSINDYFDIVVFGYLKAVQEYIKDEELKSRYAFSTIAFRLMKFSLCDYYTSCNRQKRNAPVVSMDTNKDDSMQTLNDLLPNRRKNLLNSTTDKLYVMELMSCMTEKEQRVVRLKADGYSHQEIAELCGLTPNGVGSLFSRLRKRFGQLEAV